MTTIRGVRRPAAVLGLVCCLLLSSCASDRSEAAVGRAADPATSAARPSLSPGPSRTDPEAEATAALARLDRRAQVAQLLVVGVPLDELQTGDALIRRGVGGLFLAGRSTAAVADLAATTARWQSLVPGPRLWVAADQEGGAVQALRGAGFEQLPSALAQGALPREQLAGLAQRMGAALRTAGVNLDLAPVADIVPAGIEKANPPIGAFDRQYGSTADRVATDADTVADGLSASGVTATFKHFPGLGRVTANTDTTADVVDSVTAPGDAQVTMFGALARSPRHPFVMVSTATYTRIDPGSQAAFSSAVITGLLRRQLGFDGVVITDDVGAARSVAGIPVGDRAVRFLAAGGTLILTVQPADVAPMIDAVLQRAAADQAFGAAVDAAVRTALLAKARAGLLPPAG